jgi:hypothetical protein
LKANPSRHPLLLESIHPSEPGVGLTQATLKEGEGGGGGGGGGGEEEEGEGEGAIVLIPKGAWEVSK